MQLVAPASISTDLIEAMQIFPCFSNGRPTQFLILLRRPICILDEKVVNSYHIAPSVSYEQ